MDTDRAFIWFVYVSLAVAIVLMAVTVLTGDGEGPAEPGDAIADGNGSTDGTPSGPGAPGADGADAENRSDSEPDDEIEENDTVVQDDSEDPERVSVAANDSEDENATREMADVERTEELVIGRIDDLRREDYKQALDSIYMDELWSIAEYHTSQMVTEGFFASETPGGEEYAHRFHRFDPECDRISNYRQAYEGIARIPYSPWTNSSDHVAQERRIAEQLVGNLTAPYGTFTDERYDDIGADVQYDEESGHVVTTVAIC